LPADQSRLHAQGISEAEHQPARAEGSIERVQVSEIIEHVALLLPFVSLDFTRYLPTIKLI
jgi:hypothetical protein